MNTADNGSGDLGREVRDILQAGLQQHRQGQFAQAEMLYKEVLKREPANHDAFHYLGLIACQTRRFDEALSLISRAIELAPHAGQFYSNRAVALNALGRFEEAVADYDTAISLNPGFADAHFNRGNSLASLGRGPEAIEAYDRTLALNAAHVAAHMQRGKTLQGLGQLEDAVASFSAAVAVNPLNAEAARLRGDALKDLGRFEGAVASYDGALGLNPQDVVAHSNRGGALRQLGRIDEAVASYRHAVELQPDFAMAHHNLAVCLLTRGDWEEGFREYEWRKLCPDFGRDDRFTEPAWTGEQDLAGTTLFIHPELFLGDLIQFSRYALAAEAKGASVKLAAPEHMHGLLRSLSPTIEIVSESGSAAPFDYHCALMSLPGAFATTPERTPAPIPYLHLDPVRAEAWKRQLGPEGVRIGVCWQGSTLTYAATMRRAFALCDLHGISKRPGVRLISLQKHDGLDQLQNLPAGMTVETLGDAFDEGGDAFLDTAAVMAACDLVITADTAVAHLAGALGVKTWIAIPYAPDWRWLLGRTDSPWYPSVRLFRQASRGDWDGVFSAMEQALAAEIGDRQAGS